ncbi:MAG TPA: hypothetical protein VMF91_07520 [Bryobacteraceae bacterium]|nr:hypothetical protein [Bryobacteraceae bacterium]
MPAGEGSYKDRIIKLLSAATGALSRKTSVNPPQGIEPEDEPVEPLHYTKNGNPIESWFHSGWHSDPTGRYEFREHVGRSVEGYHGGLEISPGGGEGPFYWSDGFAKEEKAHLAALEMAVNCLDGAAVESARDGETKTSSIDQGALPFRFRKPWAHVEFVMTEEERNTVNGLEARWRERYECFKDYAPVAEHQVHQRTVFRTIDRLYEALDAREHAPFADWNRLEADVEKAFRGVREAFSWQRESAAMEFSEIDRWQQEDLADVSKKGGRRRDR